MKKRYNSDEWEDLRSKIIGLGETSSKRTYYPELQEKLAQLEKFKILLDNFIDGLVVVNLKTGIVEEANKSAITMLKGLKLGEKLDPVLRNLKIENEGRFSGISKAFSNEIIADYLTSIQVESNGEERTFQFRINTQVFNNITYAVMHISDITEKENSIRAVKTSEANLSALIENTKDIIWSIDTDYRILSMNSAFKEDYNKSFNCDLRIGDSLILPYTEDERELWIERYDRVFKGESFSVDLESYVNETHKFCIISFFPIITDGVIKGAAVFLRDITERKKYELAIKENEEQLRKIIECSPIGIAVSKKGNIDFANSAALSIFGYKDLSNIKDKRITNFLAPKNRGVIDDIFTAGLNGAYMTEKLEIYGLRKTGEEIPLFVTMTGVEFFDGIAFVIFFDDVSKQKEIEQTLVFAKTKAEESEKLKTEFLAQMSHEIRTPINAILSFSSLIHEELGHVVSADLKNSFEIIQNAGKRIIRTIDLILNMSEIQAGTFELIFSDFGLFHSVLCPLVQEYQTAAEAKGIELTIEKGDGDVNVSGDDYTITQIFANLIDNAIKYTEKGYVKIYPRKDEDPDYFSVVIEDSGIGISKEYLPELFNPFSQEERGYTRRFEGNGLGLALVGKYCEMNNARISVLSDKNVGTKFIISILRKGSKPAEALD